MHLLWKGENALFSLSTLLWIYDDAIVTACFTFTMHLISLLCMIIDAKFPPPLKIKTTGNDRYIF